MMKRALDIFCALAGLVVLAPVLVVIAIGITLETPGPVFYRGRRIGRDGRPFSILKFRTMVVDADRLGGTSTSDNDSRLTPFGKPLRKYKLDELPQLFNVLIGSMSLVGPRPQVPWAVARYTPAERQLLSVRPGITDYASIRFSNEGELLRDAADPDQLYLELIAPAKVRLGLEYVYRASLLEDFKIVLATLFVAAGRRPPVRILNLDVLETEAVARRAGRPPDTPVTTPHSETPTAWSESPR